MPPTACTSRVDVPAGPAAAALAAEAHSPPQPASVATFVKESVRSPHAANAVVAIRANALTRSFGERIAIDGVSFEVATGEIFGFLGPNGAGKSTTARMLTGFIPPTSGRALVNGIDVALRPAAARRHIGVVPEEANVYADLSVWDNVMLMAELHGVDRAARELQARTLLDRFELIARSGQRGRELSKGLRQRLMLCMALVSAPEVLFLDEPTSGLDVASTHLIRDIVSDLNRERAMTVFLTTHNMEEAEKLCHRVAIIDHGRLVAIDTPTALRARMHARRSVEVRFRDSAPATDVLAPELAGREVVVLADGFRVYTPDPGPLAQLIAMRASERGLQLESVATLAPTLEDVFLSITARERS
jgi:ABC-2 type transport system ATP-binding protein